jgi:hypothetical protein
MPSLVPIQQDQMNVQAANEVECVEQQTKEEILVKKLKNKIHQNNMNIVRKNNEIRKLQQVNHQLKLSLADVVLSMQETSVTRKTVTEDENLAEMCEDDVANPVSSVQPESSNIEFLQAIIQKYQDFV